MSEYPSWWRPEEPAPSVLAIVIVAVLLALGAYVWVVGFVPSSGGCSEREGEMLKGALAFVGLLVVGGIWIALLGALLRALGCSEAFAFGVPNFQAGFVTYWYAKREGWW